MESTTIDNQTAETAPDQSTAQHKGTFVNKSKVQTNVGKRKFTPRHQDQKRGRFSEYGQNNTLDINLHPKGFMQTIKTKFRMQLRFEGLEQLARTCYRTIVRNDFRAFGIELPEDAFVYICYFTLFTRMYNVAAILNIADTNALPHLESDVQKIKTILLPLPIVRYIESVGQVISNFVAIVPWLPPPVEFFEMHREIRVLNALHHNLGNLSCNIHNYRDQFPFHEYILQVTRARRMTSQWRGVNTTIYGTPEMLLKYKIEREDDDDYITPISHVSCTADQAQLGATYRFWNAEDLRDRGDYACFPDMFKNTSFPYREYLGSICALSLVETKAGF